MFYKSTVLATLVLVFGLLICSSAAATPPACVLACLNEQGTLSDFKKLCGSDKIGPCLSSKCGNSLKAAQDHFTNTCKTNGYTASLGSSSSSTESSSASSSAAVTSSGSHVTGTAGGSSTGGSGSGSTSTPSAAAGNSASSLTVMGGVLALVALTAGFVL